MSRASRIAGVDGLRACAAMLVVSYHGASLAGATSAGRLALFAAELKAGVAVFFVISGFLLYLPFARAIGSGRELPSVREYAARRAVRILPGYWAALALLAMAGQLQGVTVAEAWRYVSLIQLYHLPTMERGLPVAWSLSVEVTFYLVLPILAWIAAQMAGDSSRTRFGPQLVLIAGLALASLLLRVRLTRSLLAPVGHEHVVLATALPGMIDWFALGMGLAVWRAAIELGAETPRRLTALAGRAGLCWLVALALYLAGVPAQRGEFFLAAYGVAAHVAIGLAAAFVVLPVVAAKREESSGFVMPFLCSAPLVWLGTISYGIYLWHFPFLRLIDPAAGQPRGVLAAGWLLVVTAAGAICLGAGSWYLIERPVHRMYAARSMRIFGALRRHAGDAA